jgi:hypothetical protein
MITLDTGSLLLINDMNNTEYANTANGQQVVRYTTNHDVNRGQMP